MLGPPAAGRNVRPYAKYDAAPDGSILMTFSDGHPGSYKNNLYYMRFKNGRFYKADGSTDRARRATCRSGSSQLDLVQKYSRKKGRPWPMDIALGSDGVAVDRLLQPRRRRRRLPLRALERHAVGHAPDRAAGGSLFGYRNGGITFNHADPSWVVLTRLIDGAQEIELRHTADQGRTWQSWQLTRNSTVLNFRPVFPRGLDDPDQLVVVYVSGVGVELPQLPHRGEDEHRPVDRWRRRPRPRRRRPRCRRPTPTPPPTPTPTPTPPGGGTPAH